MKPIILVTNKPEQDPRDFGVGEIYTVRSNYCRAILRAGGIPLMDLGGDPEDYAEIADGVLFTGGRQDIVPSLYRDENRKALNCDPELDAYELKLFDTFFRRKKPIMGICRGHQLINVALGGSLIQDIPDEIPERKAHQGEPVGNIHMHTVKTTPGSLVHSLFGEEIKTNSHHHQAVKVCGKGLIASGVTDDGVIEAIEHTEFPIYGVQWHPERQMGEENEDLTDMMPLFEHFINQCKK